MDSVCFLFFNICLTNSIQMTSEYFIFIAMNEWVNLVMEKPKPCGSIVPITIEFVQVRVCSRILQNMWEVVAFESVISFLQLIFFDIFFENVINLVILNFF